MTEKKDKILGLGAELRKYRTEIPNVIENVEEYDLDPFEFRLYVHYRKVAGEAGECYEGTRTTARFTKISIGKVSSSKARLVDLGLITIDEKPHKYGTDRIRITDLWKENFAFYLGIAPRSKCSGDEHPTPERSPDERKCSPGETKNKPIKKEEEDNKIGEIFEVYENNIGLLTPLLADDIKAELEEGTPADWILDAIKEAVKYNALNWKYISAILDNWRKKGRGSSIRKKGSNGKKKKPGIRPEDLEKAKTYEEEGN